MSVMGAKIRCPLRIGGVETNHRYSEANIVDASGELFAIVCGGNYQVDIDSVELVARANHIIDVINASAKRTQNGMSMDADFVVETEAYMSGGGRNFKPNGMRHKRMKEIVAALGGESC